MSANTQSSNLTAGFIDLATYDESEKYLYGGDTAVSYFLKKLRKSTWFTVAPTVLSISGGNAGFGQAWGYKVSRAGDYLLRNWLRIQLPAVALDQAKYSSFPQFDAQNPAAFGDFSLRWTRNLAHNLIREINIAFNDLVAERMDSYFLDFWAAFTIPAGKQNGYNNMIGNYAALNDPNAVAGAPVQAIGGQILNLPLPFFYQRDTGVALPTAAIPYNDMIINVSFREIYEVLILDDTLNQVSYPCQSQYLTNGQVPQIYADMWAEYAIVANVERSQMGKAPRDILIEQVQTAPKGRFDPLAQSQIDIRFSHAIKALFFAVRNKSVQAEQSNYTAASPVPGPKGVNFFPEWATDPITETSLLYENTARLVNMGSDYFSLVVPFYTAVSIPKETGYHMLSYTLNLVATNPMGSTNYGKLTNVSLQFVSSQDAKDASQSTGSSEEIVKGAPEQQTYEIIVVGVNHNIIRISGGKFQRKCAFNSKLLNELRNTLIEENSVSFRPICV